MKKILITLCLGLAFASCGNNSSNTSSDSDTANRTTEEKTPGTNGPDGSTLDTSRANMLTDTNGRSKDTAHNINRDSTGRKDH